MSIDIKHIAKLSKLKIADSEISKFEKEIESIIQMVENLPMLEGELSLSTDNIMDLREDVITTSLRRDDVLLNAPKKQAGCIVVPKTVEQ